jgi:quinol-cytochrome oxidoreductase complex cytochrome b subunit
VTEEVQQPFVRGFNRYWRRRIEVMGEKEKTGKAIPFFPNHFLKEVIVMCMVAAGLIVLTTLFPAPMEEPADPFVTPTHLKPEWYFLANYKILQLAEYLSFVGSWAPKLVGVLVQLVVVLVLLFFPFFDKNPERHPKKRPIMISLGLIFIILYGILVYLGYAK